MATASGVPLDIWTPVRVPLVKAALLTVTVAAWSPSWVTVRTALALFPAGMDTESADRLPLVAESDAVTPNGVGPPPISTSMALSPRSKARTSNVKVAPGLPASLSSERGC